MSSSCVCMCDQQEMSVCVCEETSWAKANTPYIDCHPGEINGNVRHQQETLSRVVDSSMGFTRCFLCSNFRSTRFITGTR